MCTETVVSGAPAGINAANSCDASTLHTNHHTIEMLHEIKVNVIFQEILQHLCAAAVNLQLLYCVRQRSIYRCSAVFLYGGGCVNRALWRRLCKRSIIRSMCFWVQEVCVSGCNLGRRPKTRWLTRCSQKSWRCPSANETHK